MPPRQHSPASPPARSREPLEANSRVQAIAKKSRAGIDPATGEKLSEAKAVSFRDALFEAIVHHAYHDERLVVYGEENRDWDGAFAVYRGLTESLPYHRLFNTPISEGAIVGTAVGYAIEGGRALVELMYCDFMGRAGDEVFNQLAKWQAMSAGVLQMPVVLRVSVGSKYGAQHSQDWSAMVAHVPGLKVVFPATPYDAKGLMASALSGSDPVVFFESQRLYGITEWFQKEVPAGYYTIPIGLPEVKRPGTDLTILSIGSTLYRAVEAADRLRAEFGVSAEIIDARSLVPFDYGPVIESVRKTGRILVTSDACERGSFPQALAATIQELCLRRPGRARSPWWARATGSPPPPRWRISSSPSPAGFWMRFTPPCCRCRATGRRPTGRRPPGCGNTGGGRESRGHDSNGEGAVPPM